jgi:hypothetical protein
MPPAGVVVLPLPELPPPCPPPHAESSEIVTEKIATRTVSLNARIATPRLSAGALQARHGLIVRIAPIIPTE